MENEKPKKKKKKIDKDVEISSEKKSEKIKELIKRNVFVDNKKTANARQDGTSKNPFKTIRAAILYLQKLNEEIHYNINLISPIFNENLHIQTLKEVTFSGLGTTFAGLIEIDKGCKVDFVGVNNFRRITGKTLIVKGQINSYEKIEFKNVDLENCNINISKK